MPDNRCTLHERVTACDYIGWLAAAAAWLSSHDFETDADDAEVAARRLMTVAGRLARPLLRDPPPERWQQQQR